MRVHRLVWGGSCHEEVFSGSWQPLKKKALGFEQCVCVCVCVSLEGCQLFFMARNGFILRSCPFYSFLSEIIMVVDGI